MAGTARLNRTVGAAPYGERVTTWEPITPMPAQPAAGYPVRADPTSAKPMSVDRTPTEPRPAVAIFPGPSTATPIPAEPSTATPIPEQSTATPIPAEPSTATPDPAEQMSADRMSAEQTNAKAFNAAQRNAAARPLHCEAVRPLASVDFVVVDVETTGWLPEQAGITEIAAVRMNHGQPTAEFSALVNPGSPIPAEITALTGITDAMVSQAPPIGAILPGFLAFARGCVLTAHNAPFDIGFLAAACDICRVPWPAFQVIDTAALARLVLSETEVTDCKLATLACFFGARTRPCHRALADARATAEVLRGLLDRLACAGVRTLAEISA